MSPPAEICVIGAGMSGLTACRALSERGVAYECLERGGEIGGGWRYENDNGVSPVYASLRTNTSRKAMRNRHFELPKSYGHFPHHSRILEYLESYADHFELRPAIELRSEVTAVRPDGDGWTVQLAGGDIRHYRAVVVANGHNWDPRWPEFPGDFDGQVVHARDYRTPEAFRDKRVVVAGLGSSAAEIVCDLASVARTAFLSYRRTSHVVPRSVWGRPFDHLDTPLGSRAPWPLQRATAELTVRLARGRLARYGLPEPEHRLLEAPVTISCDLLPRLERGEVVAKPLVERLMGDSIRFADGSVEAVDALVCATGYRTTFPFLSEEILCAPDGDIPLFQQIVHPDLPGLYFVGLIDIVGPLLPIAEAQAEWIADDLEGKLEPMSAEEMRAAIDEEAARLSSRFADRRRYTPLRARHPYLRALTRDRRRRRARRAPRVDERPRAAPAVR